VRVTSLVQRDGFVAAFHRMAGFQFLTRDDLRHLRMTVLRRVVYGLNTLALEEGRVPTEGPFDVAVANGVAAILSSLQPGGEVNSDGLVLPPTKLLKS
jgi:hypothetical protein